MNFVAAGRKDAGSKRGRDFDHSRGVAKEDARLIFSSRSGITFGRCLTVGGEHVDPDAGGKRAFPVALSDLDVCIAKAAQAVRAFPPEE